MLRSLLLLRTYELYTGLREASCLTFGFYLCVLTLIRLWRRNLFLEFETRRSSSISIALYLS